VEAISRTIPVVWVDPPTSLRAVRDSGLDDFARPALGIRFRQADDHVARLSFLVTPFPERRPIRPLTHLLLRRAIRTLARWLPGTPAAILATCYEPCLGALDGLRRAYFATDDYVAGAGLMGIDRNYLRWAERQQVANADYLIAVSELITQRWNTEGKPVLILPNGCDIDHYAAVDSTPIPPDVELEPPIAGLVGQISSRIDISLLEAVAGTGASLLIVGPIHNGLDTGRVRSLLSQPNVRWVGAKHFDELPGYLRTIHVGLTPYTDTAFNRASFPLKTLEYLAAGRGVVSTPLPSVDALGTEFVQVARGPEHFAALVLEALAEPSTEALKAARREFATRHSWARRAGRLLAELGL
jgi:teichuronic acid biosynthesis glycosyltransferase TuaH